MMGDGRLGKCKDCAKKDVRENRERRHDYYLDYDRRRSGRPERIAGIAESKRRHPLHEKARRAVHVEIAAGRMVRQPCEVCGERRVDAHHTDYSKPLEVRWLCRKHHMELHRKAA